MTRTFLATAASLLITAGLPALTSGCGGSGSPASSAQILPSRQILPPVEVDPAIRPIRYVEWNRETNATRASWVNFAYEQALAHLSRSDDAPTALAARGMKDRVQHGTRLMRVIADSLGYTTVHVQQIVDGLPVLGGHIVTTLRHNGDAAHDEWSGTFADVSQINTRPKLTEKQAIAQASSIAGVTGYSTSLPDTQLLVVTSRVQSHGASTALPARLCWQVTFRKRTVVSGVDIFWIDARTGELVASDLSYTSERVSPTP